MRIPSLIILIFLTMTGCDKQRYIRIDASSLSKNNAYINTLTISGSPSTTVALGHDYSFTPTIINLNGSPPSYSINNLPAWLDFNSSTGALTSKAGRPNIDDIGNYTNITITVTTANERAVFEAFAIEVSQPMSYYLANNGSNSNDGLSLASPFHSLDKAISVVKPGDTILLRAGTYAGVTIQENEFGDSNAWITMQPYNNEHVIIDGDIGSRRNTILFRADSLSDGSKPAAYWTIQNLEIRNGGEYSLKIDVPYVKIYHNNLHGAPNDIVKLVGTANNIEIKFNEIHHAGVGTAFQNAQGIDMVASQNVLVANNFVHDIPSVGIYAKGGAKDIIFENNLLVDILDRAIMLGQSTTAKFVKVYDIPGSPSIPYECVDCIARNNVVINAGSSCVSTSSGYNLKIYNNTCFNTSHTSQSAIFLDNQTTARPRFGSCNVEVKNNIIHTNGSRNTFAVGRADRQGIEPDTSRCAAGLNSLEIDNNIYLAETGVTNDVKFEWKMDRRIKRTTLRKWQGFTALDGNSQITDPKLANTAGFTGGTSSGFVPTSAGLSTKMADIINYFGLQAGSPAIDQGMDLPGDSANNFDSFGVNSDFNGSSRPNNITDIGAFEYN